MKLVRYIMETEPGRPVTEGILLDDTVWSLTAADLATLQTGRMCWSDGYWFVAGMSVGGRRELEGWLRAAPEEPSVYGRHRLEDVQLLAPVAAGS